LLSKTLRHKWR